MCSPSCLWLAFGLVLARRAPAARCRRRWAIAPATAGAGARARVARAAAAAAATTGVTTRRGGPAPSPRACRSATSAWATIAAPTCRPARAAPRARTCLPASTRARRRPARRPACRSTTARPRRPTRRWWRATRRGARSATSWAPATLRRVQRRLQRRADVRRAMVHAKLHEGVGLHWPRANGGNFTGNPGACRHLTTGDFCFPGCAGDADCTDFPGTYSSRRRRSTAPPSRSAPRGPTPASSEGSGVEPDRGVAHDRAVSPSTVCS